jgi:hypothetical protein
MPISNVEKERRHYLSLGNVLTLLGMAGAIAASYAALSADNADTKRRVTVVESRQSEDRGNTQKLIHEKAADLKGELTETKNQVKQIGSDVQRILIKLEAMEAVRRHEARDRQ